MGGTNSLLSSSAPVVWGLGGPLPPMSPNLPGLPPVPAGPMQPGRGVKWGPCRAGDWPGSSGASPCPSEQAIAHHSSPSPPQGPLPPATPDLPGLPPMPPGPTRPGWALELGEPAWELSRPPARVGQVIALCSSPALPRESLPPASPDLPSLRDAGLVWPPLLLPHLGSPTFYQFTLGFLLSP